MNVKGYKVIKEENLSDIHSTGTYLIHEKTGAKIACVSNDDENKVFYIGFRTPSRNSTGNAHILEHSVLCGSKKYPLKDPFVELAKGSLNTFLNAMTYPDKTVYPIASCNYADFRNLMDVYLDAVFYPNIYVHEEIFRQEGWHYELNDKDDELTINGVVYNEMKGAFSSPEEVLQRKILSGLYPTNGYFYESGGDPKNIPDLSYEQFLDFHKTLYHPSNSYIYIYGDMDMENELAWIDENYLSAFDAIEIDTSIPAVSAFDVMKDEADCYPISDEEEEEDNTYLSYSVSVGDAADAKLCVAMEVLDEVLLSSPAAPIRNALIRAGIGHDIMGGYDSGLRQPMFSVIAKNANEDQKEEFIKVIRDTLKKQIEGELDKDAIKGSIVSSAFKFREADFGRWPRGLMYGLNMLETWLYDDDQPFSYMKLLGLYDELEADIDNGYFESIIEKYLLDNAHALSMTLCPKKGLGAAQEEELRKQLAEYKSQLTSSEVDEIVASTAHLKEYQSTPDDEETMECLPLLTRDDIKKQTRPIKNRECKAGKVPMLYHDIDTNGIAYAHYIYDISDFGQEDLQIAALLSKVLGMLDTSDRSYAELYNAMNLISGGMSTCLDAYPNSAGDCRIFFSAKYKTLYKNVSATQDLLKETLLQTDFSDTDRLYEVLMEIVSSLEMKFQNAGHLFAMGRAMAQYSPRGRKSEMTSGYEFYKFLSEIMNDYEERKGMLAIKLYDICKRIFVRERMLISVTAEESYRKTAMKDAESFAGQMYAGEAASDTYVPEVTKATEGITDASMVQYVARCGNFVESGLEYDAALRVLKVILSYDYLWINIRVKGGAYGAMSGFGITGDAYLMSYRDPNLTETDEIFKNTVEYVKNFNCSDRDMTKYVIGAFGELDVPPTPATEGERGLASYMTGRTKEQMQADRDKTRLATVEDIRALAPYIESIMSSGAFAVYGNEDKIKASADMFDSIHALKA